MKYIIVLLFAICIVTPCFVNAETISVSSTSIDGAWSAPLQSGVTYAFTVSGTYMLNLPQPNTADAEFVFNPGLQEIFSWSGNWSESRDVLDLLINDNSVNWIGSTDGISWAPHTYSPSHVYKYYFVGEGQPVFFRIADQYPYGPDYTYNNSGSLSVTIQPVPEPSSVIVLVSGFGGLVGFAIKRRKGI